MVKEKIFFFQNQLATGFSALVEGATLTPKAALSRTFCGWVADELSAIGIDTYKQKKGVATGVDSMAGVNADHAAELEDGPPIGRTLQAFRLVVDSEQEPQAPAIVVEKAAKRPTAQRRRAVKCTEASASA